MARIRAPEMRSTMLSAFDRASMCVLSSPRSS
jgi:hypothetical protein